MTKLHNSPSHSNPEPKSDTERKNDAQRAEENKSNPNLNADPSAGRPDAENMRRDGEGVKNPDGSSERMVEVQLNRGYVPRGSAKNASGGYDKEAAGTVITVPASEAADLVEDGIAKPTRNAFR